MKTFYIIGCAILLVACTCVAKPRICIEAESASQIESPMRICPKPPQGVSCQCLEIREGAGNPPLVMTGKAVYQLKVREEGKYYLWCRVWWNGECGNSFNISIDGKTPFLFGEDATYKEWHWVRYPISRTASPSFLAKGEHRLELRNREDGVWIDQVLLTADKRYVPVDVEKTTD